MSERREGYTLVELLFTLAVLGLFGLALWIIVGLGRLLWSLA